MTEMTLRYPAATDAARPAAQPSSILSIVGIVVAAVGNAYRCQTDREIARLIQQNGGVITDEVERRISRHLGA